MATGGEYVADVRERLEDCVTNADEKQLFMKEACNRRNSEDRADSLSLIEELNYTHDRFSKRAEDLWKDKDIEPINL
jgi:hypothetical protein